MKPSSRRGSATPPSTKPWLAAALAAAFMPKCALCVAGYLAAGGAVAELCGTVEDGRTAAWPAGLMAGALVLVVGAWVRRKKHGDVSGPHHAARRVNGTKNPPCSPPS